MRGASQAWYGKVLDRVSGLTTKWLLAHPMTVVWGGTTLAAVMLLLCAIVLAQSRRDAYEFSSETARNVALIAQRDIDRNLELYSLSLQAVVDGYADPEVMRLPMHLRRQVLFDRAATAKYLQLLVVLDAKGNVAIDAAGDVPRNGNFAFRDYFTVLRDNPQVGLYISKPFIPLIGNRELSIALSRRLNNPDGSFGGVTVILVSARYFKDLFSGLALGPNGTITLFETNGTVVAGSPDLSADSPDSSHEVSQGGGSAAFDVAAERQLIAASTADDGSLVTVPAPDHVPRLYTFKHFAEFPLVLSVGLAESDIYAAWTRRALWIGSLMLIFGVAFVSLTLMFARQLNQRMRAQAELQLLARTDGLTGLSNRRTLDEILDGEWRRAKRAGSALAVLFVDIDWFKDFNDTYGHQAGDDALIEVALCIMHAIRRPGDRAARYGGEEFLVVLPDTGAAAALAIAEKIHSAVQALAITHQHGAHGRISVSVGVASGTTDDYSSASALVRAADDAMYQAKSTGRDKVVVYEASQAAARERSVA